MFKKLFRNIYLPIVIIAITLILFIDVFSSIMLAQALRDAYNSIDQKRISRAFDSCVLYLSSVSASTYNLSLNNTLIDELKNHDGKSLTDILDATCNYSLKINGVSVYTVDGSVYTSSAISQVPALSELKRNTKINNFIESDEDSFISLRTEYVADVYNGNLYPDKMGVITCCRKIYSDNQVIGWIFADILPSNLYNVLFSKGQFDNAVAFLSFGDAYFDYADNSARENLLSDKHKGYFKYQVTSDSALFSLTVFNGTAEYESRLTMLIGVLSVVSVALIVGVHFAAKFTAKSVTKRLDNLSAKMNSQQIA